MYEIAYMPTHRVSPRKGAAAANPRVEGVFVDGRTHSWDLRMRPRIFSQSSTSRPARRVTYAPTF